MVFKRKKNSTTMFVAESIEKKGAKSAQKTSFYRFCSDP